MNFYATPYMVKVLKKSNIRWHSGHQIDEWVGPLRHTEVLDLHMGSMSVGYGDTHDISAEAVVLAAIYNDILLRRKS